MLRKIVGLVGLPGSGKTTWFSELNLDPKKHHYIDDIKDFKLLLPGNYPDTVSMVYFSDPHLCHDMTRVKAEKRIRESIPGVELVWVFWENDLESAWINVKNRNDGRVISRSWMRVLSENYTPVEPTIEVYKE